MSTRPPGLPPWTAKSGPLRLEGPSGPPEPLGPSRPAVRPRPRRRLEFGVALSDQERYALNRQAARETLDEIYDSYYDERTGRKWPPNTLQKNIYNLMGKAGSDYAKTPITRAQWKEFKRQPNATVISQRVQEYQGELAAYEEGQRHKPDPSARPPKPPVGAGSNEEALVRGDYFRVHNANADSSQRARRMRRIIVNVNSQAAGLEVARSLNELFTDKEMGRHLWQYKIYLSRLSQPGKRLKHDKLVIYYGLADPKDMSSDPVGDKIVAAINRSIRAEDVGEGFAPFYSVVSPGIAWAEEPQAFVSALTRSFTKTRARIISGVVQSNPVIPGKAAFEKLVYEALEQARVDPERPHRHIPDVPPGSGT
ncbi:T3SS effector HopA1 family protein [Planobispora takensis]|uniref:T3SS effector HopA1 family protein n=1 Tax=Planobispora takensis TaxID=1367882 RepID=UPI0019434484|nr:T3SS effector HopA1 family protein [Planobispora takensis]